MSVIKLHRGSIFDIKADAIVNPANSQLRHSGGLARLIDEAATRPFEVSEINYVVNGTPQRPPGHIVAMARGTAEGAIQAWIEDNDCAHLVPTGSCIVTRPGRLPYKGVIHAVGPVWSPDPAHLSNDLLDVVHTSVFCAVLEEGWESVVLPAISCGIFGFPVEDASLIATEVALWYSKHRNLDITFALPDEDHYEAFAEALHVSSQ